MKKSEHTEFFHFALKIIFKRSVPAEKEKYLLTI